MKIYLAGGSASKQYREILKRTGCKYLLQTFYDLRDMKHEDIIDMLKIPKEFLLDSGAFTFMNSGVKVDWKQYIDDYCDFINKYDIKLFFELDLYVLPEIGIDNTIKIREYIEQRTGKKSIPVFHACMGLKMYRQLCKDYDYIAIGASGITDECKWVKNKELLKNIVGIAKSYGTKVHGLGYQRIDNLNDNKIGFYSVDSTSWLGSRFNSKYVLRNGILQKVKGTKDGQRMKNYLQIDEINARVFRKLQDLKDLEE